MSKRFHEFIAHERARFEVLAALLRANPALGERMRKLRRAAQNELSAMAADVTP